MKHTLSSNGIYHTYTCTENRSISLCCMYVYFYIIMVHCKPYNCTHRQKKGVSNTGETVNKFLFIAKMCKRNVKNYDHVAFIFKTRAVTVCDE